MSPLGISFHRSRRPSPRSKASVSINGGPILEIPMARLDANLQARSVPILAFAPLHKRALGVGVGAAAALVVFAMTVVHLALGPGEEPPVRLLGAYFHGYSVSVAGAFIGAGWAMLMGFAIGWFAAFSRNLLIATLIFAVRTRAQLLQFRDFLDHV